MENDNERLPFEDEANEAKEVKEPFGKCPKCGNDVIKYSWGWGCAGDKEECGLTISNVKAGVEITDEMATFLLLGQELGPYDFTSKEGKPFKAKIKIDESTGKVKYVFEDDDLAETEHICPRCGKNIMLSKYKYQCDCGLSFSRKISNHELTNEDVAGLLGEGTGLIEDFVSKAGKTFKAKLKLTDNNIEFIF